MSDEEREKVVKQSGDTDEPEVEAHQKLRLGQDAATDEDDAPEVEAHHKLKP